MTRGTHRGSLRIGSDEVHVFHLCPDDLPERRLDAAATLLDEREARRFARLRRPTVRRQYLVARALVRTVLSRYAEVEPTAWTFRPNRHGRPEIASPRTRPRLRFNISHTSRLMVCAVGLERDLGIDVELRRRPTRIAAIAHRFFAPDEAADVLSRTRRKRPDRFFDYWTLKEAYLKARGIGISVPLQSFAFDLQRRSQPSVRFEPPLQDRPTDWQFVLRRPTAEHTMAVAIRRGRGKDLKLRVRRIAL